MLDLSLLGNGGLELIFWNGIVTGGATCCRCATALEGDPGAFTVRGVFGTSRSFHGGCARCEWCDTRVSAAQRNFRPVWGKLKLRQKLKCVQCCGRDGDLPALDAAPANQ
uniref:Uncharacterized protein n=1 Tax=Pyrodinium bahamense TaxID=73915 RepID=A0A7S0FM00_9DINO|mmetsp:Transcript_37966/g.105646  ORF Transcript_37966/g.105646 Transcript_37966/m.105646 type:complete len:110 (+) Transcript_37966:82-411(+)